jgi:O-antigen ligase
MGIGVAQPLQLKRAAGRPFPRDQFAKPRPGMSRNALMGMGLWGLLWLGYNTGLGYAIDPTYANTTVNLVHAIRAFFPILAAWISILIIFTRSKRLFPWIMGPLGLMLLYAITGLASSATISIDPRDALYMGANYLAIVLVLLAIVMVEDPLPDIRLVLKFTWIVGTMITLSLLGAIPYLHAGSLAEPEAGSVGPHAYARKGVIMGMPSTRNTGFARYAAMTALVALPGLMRKGKLRVRIAWGIVFAASLYALVLANGRTEMLAFVACLGVILGTERAKRVVYFLVGTGAAILLGLRGFYSKFFLFITRTGTVDLTLTGRTRLWEGGWRILGESPWVGFGFQADRFYLGEHLHNAYLHVFLQSGFLGGGAILLGLLIVWYYLIKYFLIKQPADKSLIPPEIPAIFLFVTISSVTESTFAYFSAAWLLSAPIVAYVVALNRHLHRISAKSAQERAQRIRLERRNSRDLRNPLNLPPPTPAGGAPN